MAYRIDPKLRQALDIIDALLHGSSTLVTLNPSQTADLAAIISAQRGPDDRDEDLKYTTTAVVRKVSFPMAASKFGTVSTEKCITFNGDGFSHFIGHILKAATALRIPILNVSGRDEVNTLDADDDGDDDDS